NNFGHTALDQTTQDVIRTMLSDPEEEDLKPRHGKKETPDPFGPQPPIAVYVRPASDSKKRTHDRKQEQSGEPSSSAGGNLSKSVKSPKKGKEPKSESSLKKSLGTGRLSRASFTKPRSKNSSESSSIVSEKLPSTTTAAIGEKKKSVVLEEDSEGRSSTAYDFDGDEAAAKDVVEASDEEEPPAKSAPAKSRTSKVAAASSKRNRDSSAEVPAPSKTKHVKPTKAASVDIEDIPSDDEVEKAVSKKKPASSKTKAAERSPKKSKKSELEEETIPETPKKKKDSVIKPGKGKKQEDEEDDSAEKVPKTKASKKSADSAASKKKAEVKLNSSRKRGKRTRDEADAASDEESPSKATTSRPAKKRVSVAKEVPEVVTTKNSRKKISSPKKIGKIQEDEAEDAEDATAVAVQKGRASGGGKKVDAFVAWSSAVADDLQDGFKSLAVKKGWRFATTGETVECDLGGSLAGQLRMAQQVHCHGKARSESEYEFKGTVSKGVQDGIERARKNAQSKGPGLFSGCTFHFKGDFTSIKQAELENLAVCGGGKLMEDEPKKKTLRRLPRKITSRRFRFQHFQVSVLDCHAG
ncbi:hypothetical protein BV898_20143, partial [Hypsibius exemplaris]